jgi:hypothetical protein
MHKGESIISIAITALLVVIALGIQKQWSPATLADMASSAEEFVLTKAGLRGGIPELPGYERLETYRLGQDTAVLYRAVPAPLVFAKYQFVIFDSQSKPLFQTITVEASTQPWTALYDFNGIRGRPSRRTPGRPLYARDLTGDGSLDAVLGQYSGGVHCCTTVTVLELDQDKATVIGQVGGLNGLPFQALEIRRLDSGRSSQLIIHRPYRTDCGTSADAADVISIYAYQDRKFTEQTSRFSLFLNRVLHQNLAAWRKPQNRSLRLLQTIATDYAAAGKTSDGNQFFKTNLPLFSSQLSASGVNQQACIQNMVNLVNSLFPASSSRI